MGGKEVVRKMIISGGAAIAATGTLVVLSGNCDQLSVSDSKTGSSYPSLEPTYPAYHHPQPGLRKIVLGMATFEIGAAAALTGTYIHRRRRS